VGSRKAVAAAADDVADLLEARFFFTWYFDDDVFVASRHGGFTQTEFVDTAQDDVLRLAHRGFAKFAAHLFAQLKVVAQLVGTLRETELAGEFCEETRVDLVGRRGVLHDQSELFR
jgi:hypothetical protein